MRCDSRVTELSRRDLLRSSAIAAGALTMGPAFIRDALAAPARAGASPYGPLLAADVNGVQLPPGFSSRIIARGLATVPGTNYAMGMFPDGQATFRTRDGGWVLTTNHETLAAVGGGVSAIRFAPDGTVRSASRILAGTNVNCAGGPTPWGTWLSCEEEDDGLVWETDPAGVLEAQMRPALGAFAHEAVAVDPVHGHLYLSEDKPSAGFYRFVPDRYPSLASGSLQVAKVLGSGKVEWHRVPDPTGTDVPTRDQVSGASRFRGGEGLWYAEGVVYFTTKGDKKVWAYDTRKGKIEILFDREKAKDSSLDAVDNVTVSRAGDVLVCEDGGNMEIGIITPNRTVAPLVRIPGGERVSEICRGGLRSVGRAALFHLATGIDDHPAENRRGVRRRIRGEGPLPGAARPVFGARLRPARRRGAPDRTVEPGRRRGRGNAAGQRAAPGLARGAHRSRHPGPRRVRRAGRGHRDAHDARSCEAAAAGLRPRPAPGSDPGRDRLALLRARCVGTHPAQALEGRAPQARATGSAAGGPADRAGP